MLAKFSQSLYTYLKSNGYEDFGKIDESHVLDENTRIMVLLKSDGPVWYLILLVNADQVPLDHFEVIHSRFRLLMEERHGHYNLNNVFIISLFYADTVQSEVRDFIKASGPFTEKPVNSIFWAIELSSGNIVLNNEQPTKILNLRKLIDDSYIQAKAGAGGEEMPTVGRLNEIAYAEQPYQPKSGNALVTYILIAVNLLIFAVMEFNGGTENTANLIRFGALIPFDFSDFSQYYRLITSMFIHVGYMHLVFNSLSLFIFGTRIERYFGSVSFLIIYFTAGISGSLLSRLFLRGVSAGASGGIYGLVGAMAVLTYKAARSIEGLNYYTMIIYIIFGIGIGFMQPQIDNFGHLGGLLGGVITGILLIRRMDRQAYKLKQEDSPEGE